MSNIQEFVIEKIIENIRIRDDDIKQLQERIKHLEEGIDTAKKECENFHECEECGKWLSRYDDKELCYYGCRFPYNAACEECAFKCKNQWWINMSGKSLWMCKTCNKKFILSREK